MMEEYNIVPMKKQDIGGGISAILLSKPRGRELFVMFKDPIELEARFNEGWKIAKEQKTFEGWVHKSEGENFNDGQV